MNTPARGLRWGFWISLGLGLLWSLWRALASESFILDDEITHYLISRNVWNNPGDLWNTWSRPGRNLLQFLPAHFGLDVTRVYTLGLAGIAVWITGQEAQRMKMASIAFLPLLICFQWWFPELSYSVLTQTPFMLVWIAAIYFSMRKRLVLAALCWGYLGLVRHEGIALTALWGLWVIFSPQGFARCLFQKKWGEAGKTLGPALWLGFWTLLPMIVMNIATWKMRGEIPFMIFFKPKSTDLYGSGPIWLFLRHLLIGAGLPAAVLMLIGSIRGWSKISWNLLLYATYPAYLVLHSLVYWKGLYSSGGYYHFIMPMAPFIGLIALRGLNFLRDNGHRHFAWAMLAVVVWTGLMMPQQQRVTTDAYIEGMPEVKKNYHLIAPPMKRSRFDSGLKEAANWLIREVNDEQWLAHHVAVSYWTNGIDIGERLGAWDGYTPDSNKLRPGAILIWDAKYSALDSFGYTEEALSKNGWVEIQRFAYGSVRIYRKQDQRISVIPAAHSREACHPPELGC
jgi:predicted RNA binding protein YcfA (HicA-like mRNA interferase family)